VRVALDEDGPWNAAPDRAFRRRPGIGEFYARAIYAAIMVPAEIERLGSGVLTFDRAIEDRAASSPMMFGWLALADVRIIKHGCPPPEADELRQLIREAIADATDRVTLDSHPERVRNREPSG
jgi:hypothetical protein